MSFRQRLAQLTGIEENLLPGSYQIIGHVLLLKFMKLSELKQKRKVANAIMQLLPYIKTVCETRGVEDEFRTPIVRKLAGNGTVTLHKEHGIVYKLDAAKIMFSKGNLFERQRLLSRVKPNETIVDMFAGIGYFSLGLAKKCKKVIAIEKNSLAFRYLKENIKLNKLNNIEPILGDNRKITLQGIADRILMGYFQTDRRTKSASVGSEKFMPAAIRMLKNKGIIHYHNTYMGRELWSKPLAEMKKLFSGIDYKIIGKKKVKSVAPHAYHVVLDISVGK